MKLPRLILWLLSALLIAGCGTAPQASHRMGLTAAPTYTLTQGSDGSYTFTPATQPTPIPVPALPQLSAYVKTHPVSDKSAHCKDYANGTAISANLVITTWHQWTNVKRTVDTLVHWWDGTNLTFIGTDGKTYSRPITGCVLLGNTDLIVFALATPLPDGVVPMNLAPTDAASWLPAGSAMYWIAPDSTLYTSSVTSWVASSVTGNTTPGSNYLSVPQPPILPPSTSGSPFCIQTATQTVLCGVQSEKIGTSIQGVSVPAFVARIMTAAAALQVMQPSVIMPKVADFSGYSK